MAVVMQSGLLATRLGERLGSDALNVPGKDNSIASILSPHPDIGELVIIDTGDDFTLLIGNITHCHFDPDVVEDPEQEKLVDDIVEFVEHMLRDEIEFYGRGASGGFRKRGGPPRNWFSRLMLGRQTYVWSGPVDDA